MLLSGIYYGKTPISRVYKDGQIIYNFAQDTYVNLDSINVGPALMAYITPGALQALKAEYDACIRNHVDIRSDFAENICFVVGGSIETNAIITLQELLDCLYADICFCNNIACSPDGAEGLSISDIYSVDIGSIIDVPVGKSPNINNDIVMHSSTIGSTHYACVNTINAEIVLCDNSTATTSNSQVVDGDEHITIDCVVSGSDQSSIASFADYDVKFDSNIDADVGQVQSVTMNDCVDFKFELRPQTVYIENNILAGSMLVSDSSDIDALRSISHSAAANVKNDAQAFIYVSDDMPVNTDELLKEEMTAFISESATTTSNACECVNFEHYGKLNGIDICDFNTSASQRFNDDVLLHDSEIEVMQNAAYCYENDDVSINCSDIELAHMQNLFELIQFSEIHSSIIETVTSSVDVACQHESHFDTSEAELCNVFLRASMDNDANVNSQFSNSLVLSSEERIYHNVDISDDRPYSISSFETAVCISQDAVVDSVITEHVDLSYGISAIDSADVFLSSVISNDTDSVVGFELDASSVVDDSAVVDVRNVVCMCDNIDSYADITRNVNLDIEINNCNSQLLQNSQGCAIVAEDNVRCNFSANLVDSEFMDYATLAAKCETKHFAALVLETTWKYPIQDGASLFIRQAHDISKTGTVLVLN